MSLLAPTKKRGEARAVQRGYSVEVVGVELEQLRAAELIE
jgi:hypothetical protein